MSAVVDVSPVKTFIHSSACVEPGAQLGSGVHIGPFCHVGPEARLGDGVALISHVVVAGVTEIGARGRVFRSLRSATSRKTSNIAASAPL